VLKTDRTIYCAIGEFDEGKLERAYEKLQQFQHFFEKKADILVLEDLFEGEVLELARKAATKIKEFEEMAGTYTGAVVQKGFSSPLAGIGPKDKPRH